MKCEGGKYKSDREESKCTFFSVHMESEAAEIEVGAS